MRIYKLFFAALLAVSFAEYGFSGTQSVDMCSITAAARQTRIAAGEYAVSSNTSSGYVGCQYNVGTSNGDTFCLVTGALANTLPVPAGRYLSAYYEYNTTCAGVGAAEGTMATYGGTSDDVCLVPNAWQTIPSGSVLSVKGNQNAVCPESLGLVIAKVKVAADGVVWCKPNAGDTRISSPAPKGYFITPDTSTTTCPGGTTPYKLDSIGTKNSGDVCISSYSEVPDRAFVATKKLSDPNAICGTGSYLYALTKVTSNSKTGVCSIANTYGHPSEFVIKNLQGNLQTTDNCYSYFKYDVELASGSQINNVCPQSEIPTGYFVAPLSSPPNSTTCNLVYKRLTGSQQNVCLDSSASANSLPGWYPSAQATGYCPANMQPFTIKMLSGNADSVVWFNTSWWLPTGYVVVPSNCSLGVAGLRCAKIAPAADDMSYCNGTGVVIPTGYSKGAVANVAPLVCPSPLSPFKLIMDPPPVQAGVSNPTTFINPETPAAAKPATVPVLDFSCPGGQC